MTRRQEAILILKRAHRLFKGGKNWLAGPYYKFDGNGNLCGVCSAAAMDHAETQLGLSRSQMARRAIRLAVPIPNVDYIDYNDFYAEKFSNVSRMFKTAIRSLEKEIETKA